MRPVCWTLMLLGSSLFLACSDDDDPPPVLTVTCSATPQGGATPLAVSLAASATGSTDPCAYAWVLGDGTSETTQNPSHTYTTGNHTATVTATCGRSTGTCSTTIKVVTDPLKVTCGGDPASGSPPLDVSFTSSATGGLQNYVYAWDLGDGSTAATHDLQHTYKRVGKFSATVTVTSDVLKETCKASVNVHIDTQVTVPAGGGKDQITLDAVKSQTLTITLTAADSTLVPYGYMENPDGTGSYVPDENTAKDGKNSGQITLTQDGTHTLAIHDAMNQGGAVTVIVEEN